MLTNEYCKCCCRRQSWCRWTAAVAVGERWSWHTNTENQPPTAVASTSRDGVDGMQLSDVGGSRRVFSGTGVVNNNEAAHVIASKRKNCRAVQKKRKKRSASKAKKSAKRNKKDCCCLICSDNNRDLASMPGLSWLVPRGMHRWRRPLWVFVRFLPVERWYRWHIITNNWLSALNANDQWAEISVTVFGHSLS